MSKQCKLTQKLTQSCPPMIKTLSWSPILPTFLFAYLRHQQQEKSKEGICTGSAESQWLCPIATIL